MAVFRAFNFLLKERLLKISEDFLYFLHICKGRTLPVSITTA
jgi:hypothetical protein